VISSGQTITYCGVSAHFQNGVAEKRIRDLQDVARTMLIHAYRRWATAISVNLWPYAMRQANDMIRNATPNKKQTISPTEKFSGVAASTKLDEYHPFGCPVYVLDSKMQNGQKLPKWSERARVGI